MKLIVDTHVHIYPFYQIEAALNSIIHNFNQIDADAVKVACLTERFDCDVFSQLATRPSTAVSGIFEISSGAGNGLIIRRKDNGQSFVLLPGQQIITSENLEVLALNCPERIDEGNSAAKTIDQVNSRSGIPVVAWGLGKWLSRRGKIVEKLIDDFEPGQFAIGDTTMRPYGWSTPALMKKARNKGFKILYGSDPLPFNGEEIRPGSYACQIDTRENSLSCEDAIYGILSGNYKIESAGKRGSIIEVAKRTLKHRNASKIAAAQAADKHVINPSRS